jgi:hypothetical protein
MTILRMQRRCARFELRDEGRFVCNLDRAHLTTREEGEVVAAVVLPLGDEIATDAARPARAIH